MAPKRTRDDGAARPSNKRTKGEDGTTTAREVDPAVQQAETESYMFHAVKLLAKALKKSKTVELQKLVRKVKAAKETNEVKDLEDQLAALKAMDLDSLPAYILTHRLPKLTFLHPILESVLSSIPESTTLPTVDAKTAEGKGRNRVLANKLVKEATDEVIRAVSKRMGQEVEDRPVVVKVVKKVEVEVVEVELPELEPGKRLSKRALRAAKGAAKALLPKKGMDPSRKAAIEAATRLEGDDGDADSEEGDGFVSGSDDEADDDDEVMREMARLGGGSEYSDEDNSDEGEEYNSDAALSASSPPKPSTSKSKPKASFPPPKSTKSSRTVSKPITSSAFLPSLASGYISYSDSDGEDAHWVKEEEKGDKKERKNRRGQRARQAIWEQKYGSGANHVVKSTGATPAPTKGGKANRGDTKQRTTKPVPIAPVEILPFNPATAVGAERNSNAEPVAARRVSTVEKGMHPSWEAKRKAADALKDLAAAPRGKKTVFA